MSIRVQESLVPDRAGTGEVPPRRRLALVAATAHQPEAAGPAEPRDRRPRGRARRYLRAAVLGQLLCLALLGLVVLFGPGPYPGLLSGELGQDHGDHLVPVDVTVGGRP